MTYTFTKSRCIMSKQKEKGNVADIARMVGVSPGTVSNALNNRNGVSKETKDKILAVAKELGYTRNHLRKQDNTIKFVQIKRHGNVVGDTYFFSEVIQGIERKCRKNHFELSMVNINLAETTENEVKQYFQGETSDGIIVLATEMWSSDQNMLKSASQPLVILDNSFRLSDYDCVLIDNEGGVYSAIKYLVEMGHRRIGILHSSAYINNFYIRKKAFHFAMSDFGLSVRDEDVYLLSSNIEGAYQDMLKSLETINSLPTALFADNDLIALGAIRALKEKGYSIPEDVSIIGFDDTPFCEMSSPTLSTVCVDKQGMGALAVKQIIGNIKRGTIKSITKTHVATKLIIRNSVARVEPEKPLENLEINKYL